MKNHSRFSWTHKCSIHQTFAVSYSRWLLLCFPRLVSRNRAPGLGGQSNQMDTTLWVFYGTCLPSGAAFFSPEKYAAFPPGTPVVNRSSACSHERWKIAHLHLEQLCLCESSTNYIHLRKGNVRNKYIITTVRPTVNSSSRNAFIPTEASRSIFLTYSWMTRGRSSVIWASGYLLERVLRELFRSFQLTHARDQIKSVQLINNE